MRVQLHIAAIPALPGALECIQSGQLSSLHVQNAKACAQVANISEVQSSSTSWPLLCDPQTAGGLLGAVPQHKAAVCVQHLIDAGYDGACVVGVVCDGVGHGADAGDSGGADGLVVLMASPGGETEGC